MSRFRIYPSFGVARVGKSPEFVGGPEHPGVPANWDEANQRFFPFKDEQGLVKRQAARFRVFEVDDAGRTLREVTTGDGTTLQWRVHSANRKASFFLNLQRTEAACRLSNRTQTVRPSLGDAIEKPNLGVGQPERRNLRNHGVVDRASLDIDPGELIVPTSGTVRFEVPNAKRRPSRTSVKLQMEVAGSLLKVFGGNGESASSESSPPPIERVREQRHVVRRHERWAGSGHGDTAYRRASGG